MISFVVPVYNAQRTLAACVDSLLAQKEDFEIVLIDDGSKDDSPTICDAYAARDDRVRVIHQPNAGITATRNVGLANARGKYLWFVDSDDWIEPNASELMLAAAEAAEADIAVCSMSSDYVDTGISVLTRVKTPGEYRGREALARALCFIEEQKLLTFPTNKLYRMDFLKRFGLRFTMPSPVEDVTFNLDALREARCVALVGEALYHYMQYGGKSLARNYRVGLYELCRGVNEKRRALYRDWGMASEAEANVCAYACFLQDFHAVVNAYRTDDKRVRRELWRLVYQSEQIRKEAARCAKHLPEAKLLCFALGLGSPWAANAFFSVVMGARRNLGPVYSFLRDKILFRGRLKR